MYGNELCHHGILGMKWGHRRYQNKDGSLTPEGRRRAMKVGVEKQGTTHHQNKAVYKVKAKNKSHGKHISEMSDSELRDKINRRRLENEYNKLYPSNTSLGKKIVMRALDDMVVPASINVGRKYLETQMSKALNISPPKSDKKK